ncbi:MAG: pyridoxamine 5'-phosphate oxidase family protein [Candidatus Omnitrophica bacterium]|nr:pyridoxamine 5'-phosphate oxidase family protein [Candidatus Omnitrophota bacterium]
MINKDVRALIESREFISVASCDLEGRPNAAPKFLLKVESDCIYLVDYIIGRTFRNLNVNPKVSLSFFDNNTLVGYQINGKVEIIDSGPEYLAILNDLQRREVDLSATRIIDGGIKGRPHKAYEAASSKQFIILKVEVEEIVQMQSSGTLRREKIR